MARRVFVESPFKGRDWGDTEENIHFARLCMYDSFTRGEAPFVPHLLYPQVLNDKVTVERNQGIEHSFEWKKASEFSAIYINRGIYSGMYKGIRESVKMKQDFEYRFLASYARGFRRPRIITLSGASGAGKTTIARKLIRAMPAIRPVQSLTSRGYRAADLPDEYRYFAKEVFEDDREKFLWKISAHGNFYGTIAASVARLFPESYYPDLTYIMTLTPEALPTLMDYVSLLPGSFENCILPFYVISPGEEQLWKRLILRGEDGQSAKRRVDDCKSWDEEALTSHIPYLFLQNKEGDGGADEATAQVKLFTEE